ncbi:hypothetical protein [Oceanospirillum sediminis]|uniref:Killer suppression protein HigA n=1 Tax=Oceanospirillum sediminis TaxID=2760088 RepID=A0A839ILK0_9GAMM|nr:hypothetical protein [Oceanospirillum sediminis]MBB1485761.1 hypothetical protein [Oceanospirillum sediminis]
MELRFEDEELRELCIHEHRAQDHFGTALSNKLKRWLADLSAATDFSDLFELPGMSKALDNETNGRIEITLMNQNKLVLVCGHATPPKNADGTTNWSKVHRVKLLRIESHG